jgi:hypothetical protein
MGGSGAPRSPEEAVDTLVWLATLSRGWSERRILPGPETYPMVVDRANVVRGWLGGQAWRKQRWNHPQASVAGTTILGRTEQPLHHESRAVTHPWRGFQYLCSNRAAT